MAGMLEAVRRREEHDRELAAKRGSATGRLTGSTCRARAGENAMLGFQRSRGSRSVLSSSGGSSGLRTCANT